MVNCVVVDKSKEDRKKIEYLINDIKHLCVIKSCEKLQDAAEVLSKGETDILILNITPDVRNKTGLLQDVRSDRMNIIVTSDLREVANEAYDIDAVDFILKPVTASRLAKAIIKLLKIKDNNKIDTIDIEENIFIKVKKHLIKITLKDIFLVEALADYVNIHTNSKRYTIHATMKEMEKKLPRNDFIRVHKSYIVRLDYINEVNKKTLSVQKKTIRISNTYRKELMEKLKII